jgi:hypothetical protein
LENFWNLDTGLGLTIQNVASASAKEVRTRIKLPHITEVTHLGINHQRQDSHIGGETQQKYDLANKYGYQADKPAFDAIGGPVFETSRDVFETSKSKYLDAIVTVQERGTPLRDMSLDEFFSPSSPRAKGGCLVAGTDSIDPKTVVRCPRTLASRLTLEFEAPIVKLGDKEVTGFALYTDKGGSTAAAQAYEEDAAKKWLDSKTSQCLRFIEDKGTPQLDVKLMKGRAHFKGRILLNFDEWSRNVVREVEKGKWNNVIGPDEVTQYLCRGGHLPSPRVRERHAPPRTSGGFGGGSEDIFSTPE